MNAILISAACSTLILATPAFAQQAESTRRLGEHPAVIVKRNFEKQGYDYASKFYPHPAWLYLQSGPSYGDRTDVATANERPSETAPDAVVASAPTRSAPQH